MFNSGETGLPTWYNCVGRTTYPCSAADSVEIVTLGGSAAIDAGLSYEAFKPDKVVIQVLDPQGRTTSSEDDSSALVWSTGYGAGVVVRPGVILSEELVSLDPSQWGVDVDNDDTRAITLNVEVSGPGKLATWADDDDIRDPFEWFGSATNGALTSGNWFVDPGSYPWYAEFSKLGTYRVHFDGAISANNGTPVNTADDTSYTIAERTYVFHVGPIADVGVSDGGGQSLCGCGPQRADDSCRQQRPDHALGAQVAGLPTGAEVLHVSHGSYNSISGEWDIGELRPSSHYQSRGESDPTLVLSAADGQTANVSIAAESYKVCIGSGGSTLPHTTEAACVADTTNGGSWHTGPVYDHNAANNTVAIAAHAGASEPHPSAPKDLSVMETPLLNIVQWSPVDNVNDLEVAHYQVERWTGRWTPLADGVPWTWYLDLEGRPNADYRVRALNAAGVPGLWSITGRPPDAPGDFTVALSDGGNGAVLSWTVPASPTPVTGYVIDISDSAEGDNRTNDATVGANVTTWTHTGLSGGDVKFYRVQAPQPRRRGPVDRVAEREHRARRAGQPAGAGQRPQRDRADLERGVEPGRDDLRVRAGVLGHVGVPRVRVDFPADGAS